MSWREQKLAAGPCLTPATASPKLLQKSGRLRRGRPSQRPGLPLASCRDHRWWHPAHNWGWEGATPGMSHVRNSLGGETGGGV